MFEKPKENFVLETVPALEIHYDDVGAGITIINDRVWVPLIQRRPCLFGPDRFNLHLVAWAVTHIDILPICADRVMSAIGHRLRCREGDAARRIFS